MESADPAESAYVTMAGRVMTAQSPHSRQNIAKTTAVRMEFVETEFANVTPDSFLTTAPKKTPVTR